MESKPQITAREFRILLIYGLTAIGVVVLFFVLSWVRAGAPTRLSEPKRAEIAVLVPLNGKSGERGKKILDAVAKTTEHFAGKQGLEKWEITVRAYDTGNSSQAAAWAAYKAARNPDTVAIIGPFDAREVGAIKSGLLGRQIPIITTASTTPTLKVSSTQGVYRVPGTDDLQGQAIVDFVQSARYSSVFLLAERNDYAKNVLVSLMDAGANNRLKLVGSIEINDKTNKTDLLKKIYKSKANAVIYLGESKTLKSIIQGFGQTKQNIPIIGTDSLNDPKLAELLSNNQELFFTSPIYVNQSTIGPYSVLPANKAAGPYSFESVEATWLVLRALSSTSGDGLGRKIVWENLADATIQRFDGKGLKWVDGQLAPTGIFVYKGTTQPADWFYKPIHTFTAQ